MAYERDKPLARPTGNRWTLIRPHTGKVNLKINIGSPQWLTPRLILVACLVIGTVRIVATYQVFTQTWDEPVHVATGMEWLDRGTYTYESLHPPLARIATAIGPRLAGIRSTGYDLWLEGNSILYAGGQYDRNLALARLGILPFFLIAALVVFAWANRLAGSGTAVVSVILFTTLPPVLGHAGLATTDMAVTATVALACYCAVLWIESPTPTRSVGLGLTTALAVLSKFSALLFLPAAGVAITACRRGEKRDEPQPAGARARRTTGIRIAYLSALLTVWAGYRFAVGPLVGASDAVGAQPQPGVVDRLARAPVYPAPALFDGVGQLAAKNRHGHKSYLLGEVRSTGWWYFFPVAIAVKTPIAFLLLVLTGTVAIFRTPPGPPRRRLIEPFAIAGAILLVCIPSRINIGLRHVLPIYPFLAITAGFGSVALWRARRSWPLGPTLMAAFLGWQLVSSTRVHPDYLAYFNELAGDEPERILVDSDLDDGQDLKRLADTLRARRIPEIWLAYAGSATVAEHGLPPVRWLQPRQPVTGWVAASLYSLKCGSLNRPEHDDYAWLERYRPVVRVGTSIRLYYIP